MNLFNIIRSIGLDIICKIKLSGHFPQFLYFLNENFCTYWSLTMHKFLWVERCVRILTVLKNLTVIPKRVTNMQYIRSLSELDSKLCRNFPLVFFFVPHCLQNQRNAISWYLLTSKAFLCFCCSYFPLLITKTQ